MKGWTGDSADREKGQKCEKKRTENETLRFLMFLSAVFVRFDRLFISSMQGVYVGELSYYT